MWFRLSALILSVFLVLQEARAQGREIRVAAAADLKFAMEELSQQFEKQTGTRVNVTYGSSGNFFSQIQNGAPFDLFFSADIEYPRKLEAVGLTEPGTLYEYAVGTIVIWMSPDAKVDVTVQGWKALLDASVEKIAIANPEHAPYGRAAVAALQKAGIYEQVKLKLIYGENISQAAQFVQSGNAQAGIVALSLAGANTRARDAINGYSRFAQNAKHPDVRNAARKAACKGQADARTLLGFALFAVREGTKLVLCGTQPA